ncbi:MAG: response regulator [SAR324 cluster bacterium]|nr:response regulator [SAR324 cluster bacterium]
MTTAKTFSNQNTAPQVLGKMLEDCTYRLKVNSFAQNSFFLISLGPELPPYISLDSQNFTLFITEIGRLLIKNLPNTTTLIRAVKRLGQIQKLELSFSTEPLLVKEQTPQGLNLKTLFLELSSSDLVQNLTERLNAQIELDQAYKIISVILPLEIAQGEALPYFNRFHHQLAQKSLLILSDQPYFIKYIVQHTKKWGLQPFYYSNYEMEKLKSPSRDFALAIAGPAIDPLQGLGLINRFFTPPKELKPIQIDFTQSTDLESRRLNYPFTEQELFTALIEATASPLDEVKTEAVKIFSRDLGGKNPLRIMVVDDNKLNLQVMDKILMGFGYKAKAHDNPFDAIENLKTEHFDLVFLDIQMPKMDGCQALQKVKRLKLPKEPIFVALTAKPKDEFGTSFFKLGFDDFFAKPIMPKDLKILLQKWQQSISKNREEDPSKTQNSHPKEDPLLVEDVVKSRIDLGWDFFQNAVEDLISDLARLYTVFRLHLDINQFQTIAEKAHFTKGSCANLGCYRLELALENVVQACNIEDATGCQDAISLLPEIITDTITSLQQLLTSHLK